MTEIIYLKSLTRHQYHNEVKEKINVCPYVGWSGGCDDCKINLDPITCQEELKSFEMENVGE